MVGFCGKKGQMKERKWRDWNGEDTSKTNFWLLARAFSVARYCGMASSVSEVSEILIQSCLFNFQLSSLFSDRCRHTWRNLLQLNQRKNDVYHPRVAKRCTVGSWGMRTLAGWTSVIALDPLACGFLYAWWAGSMMMIRLRISAAVTLMLQPRGVFCNMTSFHPVSHVGDAAAGESYRQQRVMCPARLPY